GGVVVASGVRRSGAGGGEGGMAVGESGAVAVDAEQRTGVPDVFAAGDCAEARHVVLDRPVWVPLGTTANKQGKVAGANAAGGRERFAGIAGTAGFKLFDLEVGRTGLGDSEALRHGLDAVHIVSRHHTRALVRARGEPRRRGGRASGAPPGAPAPVGRPAAPGGSMAAGAAAPRAPPPPPPAGPAPPPPPPPPPLPPARRPRPGPPGAA